MDDGWIDTVKKLMEGLMDTVNAWMDARISTAVWLEFEKTNLGIG